MKLHRRTVIIGILLLLALALWIFPFIDPEIMGATVTKVFVRSDVIFKECTIPLVTGWNLISISCLPTDNSIASMLGSIDGNYTSLHEYDASDSSDYWKIHNPSLPSWVVQDITSLTNTKGYWIFMTANDTIERDGFINIPTGFSVQAGWNLIGFPAANQSDHETAYPGANYNFIWAYNATTGEYEFYDITAGNGTLHNVTPDRGYWVNFTESGVVAVR